MEGAGAWQRRKNISAGSSGVGADACILGPALREYVQMAERHPRLAPARTQTKKTKKSTIWGIPVSYQAPKKSSGTSKPQYMCWMGGEEYCRLVIFGN